MNLPLGMRTSLTPTLLVNSLPPSPRDRSTSEPESTSAAASGQLSAADRTINNPPNQPIERMSGLPNRPHGPPRRTSHATRKPTKSAPQFVTEAYVRLPERHCEPV